MSLHLVELPLSLRALHLWAGGRKIDAGSDEGLALHHLLGEVFGPAALQPFRLMVAPRAQHGTLYAYSTLPAEALRPRATAGITPAHADVIALERLRSLPRPETSWTPGQRLGFDLRIRPVIRLASALEGQDASGATVGFRKGAEIDAFLAAALRGRGGTRESVYLDWLAERLGPAATLEPATTRLARFQRSNIRRNGRKLEGPDAVIHGTLVIADPAAFVTLLAAGIGRHRSYGYGMLLLRPPQRVRSC